MQNFLYTSFILHYHECRYNLFVRLAFHVETDDQNNKNMSRKEWELIAKLDVVASVMNFERDQYGDYRRFVIDCLNDESSEYHRKARMYFDALVPVSKEEFEKMTLKEVWSK